MRSLVVVVTSDEIDAPTRATLRQLWADAFGDRFSDDDAEHAYGGVHVIAYDGEDIVGHASVIPRRIRIGEEWVEAGYVEAVATRPDRERTGVGTAIMRRLHEEIDARWPAAFLSTGRARGFYLRLGWQVWEGELWILTEEGEVPSQEEHGGILGRGADLDPTLPLMCEDRAGDAW